MVPSPMLNAEFCGFQSWKGNQKIHKGSRPHKEKLKKKNVSLLKQIRSTKWQNPRNVNRLFFLSNQRKRKSRYRKDACSSNSSRFICSLWMPGSSIGADKGSNSNNDNNILERSSPNMSYSFQREVTWLSLSYVTWHLRLVFTAGIAALFFYWT